MFVSALILLVSDVMANALCACRRFIDICNETIEKEGAIAVHCKGNGLEFVCNSAIMT